MLKSCLYKSLSLRMTFPNLGDWTSPQSERTWVEGEANAKIHPSIHQWLRRTRLHLVSLERLQDPSVARAKFGSWFSVISRNNVYHEKHISSYIYLSDVIWIYVFPYILHVSIHKYAMRFEYFYHYHYISIIINWLCLIMISINWLSLSWSINLSLMIDFV